MNKFEKLEKFIQEELKRLRVARDVCMTTTEKYLLDGRIVDLQRITSEAYKIKKEENNG